MRTATAVPRRSHEYLPSDTNNTSSSTSDEQPEPRRRTSSDSTPRPAPASTRFLCNTASSEQDANRNILPNSAVPPNADVLTSSKRLGFFADKISSSLSSGAGVNLLKAPIHATQLLHPHSHTTHSKSESSSSTSPSVSPSNSVMNASASTVNLPKPHTSPSKGSYGRTYDSNVVTREMHRLASQLSSGSSMALVPPGSMSQVSLVSTNSAEPWGALHVHVLPLFNGEPLRTPIEDLNTLVKRHIQTVVTSTPNRALSMLEVDAGELIASGMVTLNAKIMGVEDRKLIGRVVETWNFFWDQVLTYLEGVLLPLQTHPLLSSLYRTPKTHHRAASPNNRQNGVKASFSKSGGFSDHSSNRIDVRTIALRSFRDKIVLPLSQQLTKRLREENVENVPQTYQPRLQQMLLVLASQCEPRPTTFSLSSPDPEISSGAAAVENLLHTLRTPPSQYDRHFRKSSAVALQVRASFLSGVMPRDRRGRVPHKQRNKPMSVRFGDSDEEDGMGEATPRLGRSFDTEYARRMEALDSGRSSDAELTDSRMSGGWGLGAGQPDIDDEEDEENDQLNLQEKLNADLNRMVGITPPASESRRRMT